MSFKSALFRHQTIIEGLFERRQQVSLIADQIKQCLSQNNKVLFSAMVTTPQMPNIQLQNLLCIIKRIARLLPLTVKNAINGIKTAREQELWTCSLTGESGGQL